jgi:hypothetical protein
MDLSKFEKQVFATLPRVREFPESRGNKQKDKISPSIQVKRLWKKARGVLSLKAWAKPENTPLTNAWLKNK